MWNITQQNITDKIHQTESKESITKVHYNFKINQIYILELVQQYPRTVEMKI